MKFGFLIDSKEFECKGFRIAPVLDFDSILDNFKSSVSVRNGWLYGPKIELLKSTSEKNEFKADSIVINSSFFRMNQTHEITSTEG